MINIIINHLTSFKNKIFIFIYFLILITIFIIPLPFDAKGYELIIELGHYKINYNEIVVELLKLITAIGILIIALEHNQGYINNITTYKNRESVLSYKLFIYIYLVVINSLIVILIYYFILNTFNYNMLISSIFINQVLSITIDNIILLLLVLLFVRSNNKIIGYIIIVIYYILNIFYLNIDSVALFYVIPFYSYYYHFYSNTYIYITTYILLLIVLNYYKYINEDFLDK